MKKGFLYGLIASVSVFSIAAYADPVADADSSALTTKGYVDTGLKYVYDAIKGDVGDVQGDITNLQNTVGNTDMGTNADTITGAISELNSAVQQLGTPNQYTDGDGIKVTPGANQSDPSSIGLDLPSNPSAGSYVYKIDANGDGTWAPIEVEDSWDPGFLTNP